MRIERALWISLSIFLAAVLAVTYNRHQELKRALLAGERDTAYVDAALKRFTQREGATRKDIENDFYVTYVGLSNRSCIRLVPKPKVTGSATTYCFTQTRPPKLIGSDEPAE